MDRKSARKRRTLLFKKNILYLMFMAYIYLKIRKKERLRNIIRDRDHPLHLIREKSDIWFHKSYRLPRNLFYDILVLIAPKLECSNHEMARKSSGPSLNPEILLAATLRYLAGGSYIDIVDLYRFPPTCAHQYFWRTIDAIDNPI